jgi:vacuolar-type H+-ATPase subunit I/STV1
MAFFSPEKLKQRRIEIDESSATSESAEVQKRLNRIEANYQQLDDILADLESKIDQDERLKAIDDANVDFEATYGIKKKRKWKPAKPKSKTKRRRAASVDPKKPR